MNKFTAYLCLIRLMHDLKVPFQDRMSMKEFEVYAEKIRNKKASQENKCTNKRSV